MECSAIILTNIIVSNVLVDDFSKLADTTYSLVDRVGQAGIEPATKGL